MTVHTYVQLWSEDMIGDGCSIIYENGGGASFNDNDDEAEGYLEAMADMGHKVQITKVDVSPSGMDWQEAAAWWYALDYSDLQKTLDAFAEQGFLVEAHVISEGTPE